jgi:hypothetical protein
VQTFGNKSHQYICVCGVSIHSALRDIMKRSCVVKQCDKLAVTGQVQEGS